MEVRVFRTEGLYSPPHFPVPFDLVGWSYSPTLGKVDKKCLPVSIRSRPVAIAAQVGSSHFKLATTLMPIARRGYQVEEG